MKTVDCDVPQIELRPDHGTKITRNVTIYCITLVLKVSSEEPA